MSRASRVRSLQNNQRDPRRQREVERRAAEVHRRAEELRGRELVLQHAADGPAARQQVVGAQAELGVEGGAAVDDGAAEVDDADAASGCTGPAAARRRYRSRRRSADVVRDPAAGQVVLRVGVDGVEAAADRQARGPGVAEAVLEVEAGERRRAASRPSTSTSPRPSRADSCHSSSPAAACARAAAGAPARATPRSRGSPSRRR